MATRTVKERKNARRAGRASGVPVPELEKSWRRRPGCECRHEGVPCPDPATHRVSELCAERDCRTAVHVHLVCGECLANWLEHAETCPHRHEWRVTPL